jgi:hypothetical protein
VIQLVSTRLHSLTKLETGNSLFAGALRERLAFNRLPKELCQLIPLAEARPGFAAGDAREQHM